MCGRKTLTKDRENIIRTFQVDWWEGEPTWEPHYNISPLMQVPVLFFDGQRIVRLMNSLKTYKRTGRNSFTKAFVCWTCREKQVHRHYRRLLRMEKRGRIQYPFLHQK